MVRYVVVGGGVAGVACVDELLIHSDPEVDEIIFISSSSVIKGVKNYVKLSDSLESFDIADHDLHSYRNQYRNVTVVEGIVDRVIADSKVVVMNDGSQIKFDKICLCTGATPRLLLDHPLIVGLRDSSSVDEIAKLLRDSKRIVVVGNGGIALGIVHELRGTEIVWSIKDNYIGNTFFDASASKFFLSDLEHRLRDPNDSASKSGGTDIINVDAERHNEQSYSHESTYVDDSLVNLSEFSFPNVSTPTSSSSAPLPNPSSAIDGIDVGFQVLPQRSSKFGRSRLRMENLSSLPQFNDVSDESKVITAPSEDSREGSFPQKRQLDNKNLSSEVEESSSAIEAEPKESSSKVRGSSLGPAWATLLRNATEEQSFTSSTKKSNDLKSVGTSKSLDVNSKFTSSSISARSAIPTENRPFPASIGLVSVDKDSTGATSSADPVLVTSGVHGVFMEPSLHQSRLPITLETQTVVIAIRATGYGGGSVGVLSNNEWHILNNLDRSSNLFSGPAGEEAARKIISRATYVDHEEGFGIIDAHEFKEPKESSPVGGLKWKYPLEVCLSSGRIYGCDFIISAIGVTPNTEIYVPMSTSSSDVHPVSTLHLPSSGNCVPRVLRNIDGGLLVNKQMQVSGSGGSVYAAGDCAAILWPRLSAAAGKSETEEGGESNMKTHSPAVWFQQRLWNQARIQGAYAARSMAGKLSSLDEDGGAGFEIFTHMTSFMGYKVVLLGLYNGQGLGLAYENCLRTQVVSSSGPQVPAKGSKFMSICRSECTSLTDSATSANSDSGSGTGQFEVEVQMRITPGEEYCKVVILNGKVVGAMLIGDTDLEETFEHLILNGLDIRQVQDDGSYRNMDLLDPTIDIEDYFD